MVETGNLATKTGTGGSTYASGGATPFGLHPSAALQDKVQLSVRLDLLLLLHRQNVGDFGGDRGQGKSKSRGEEHDEAIVSSG
jgi:hypothetical protein